MAKQKQSSAIVAMAMVGILCFGLYYLYQGSLWVSAQVDSLPVEGQMAAKTAANAAPVRQAPKTLHPLLIESSRKAAAVKAATRESVSGDVYDSVFGKLDADKARAEEEARKKEEAKKVANPEPAAAVVQFDYFGGLKSSVRVMALTPSGAIVNGRYVEKGAALEELAYPDLTTGEMVFPVLASVDAKGIVLREAKGRRTIRAELLPE